MSTTTAIPMDQLQRLASQVGSDPLLGVHRHPAPVDTVPHTESASTSGSVFLRSSNPGRIFMTLLVNMVRVSSDQDFSRPVELSPLSMLAIPQLQTEPEQVEFEWTKRSHRIREIARQYSETTHADY